MVVTLICPSRQVASGTIPLRLVVTVVLVTLVCSRITPWSRGPGRRDLREALPCDPFRQRAELGGVSKASFKTRYRCDRSRQSSWVGQMPWELGLSLARGGPGRRVCV